MKGSLVALLVVTLLALVAGVYLLSHPSSTSSTSTGTGTVPTHSTSSASSVSPIQGPPADVTVSYVSCISNQGTCVISLANSGGTAVEATGCTMNGSPGVLSPKLSSIPPQALVNISCSPSNGNSLAIPGFHITGAVQLSDGSSVQFTGNWQ